MPTSFLRQEACLLPVLAAKLQLLLTRSGSIIAKPVNNVASLSFFFTRLPIKLKEKVTTRL